MDSRKYMLLVNGQDKTDSVASFRFQNGMCEVIYANSPKSYRYHAEKVQLLKVQNRIDPSQFIIWVVAMMRTAGGRTFWSRKPAGPSATWGRMAGRFRLRPPPFLLAQIC